MALNTQTRTRSLTLMGASVTLDNGTTAAALAAIDQRAQDISRTLETVNEHVALTPDKGLLKEFSSLLVDHVKPLPPPAMPQITTTAAFDRIRFLAQVQTLALDRHPGQTGSRPGTGPASWTENVAMARLRTAARRLPDNLGPLAPDFDRALQPFATVELPERAQRLAFVHDLIRRIAQHLK